MAALLGLGWDSLDLISSNKSRFMLTVTRLPDDEVEEILSLSLGFANWVRARIKSLIDL